MGHRVQLETQAQRRPANKRHNDRCGGKGDYQRDVARRIAGEVRTPRTSSKGTWRGTNELLLSIAELTRLASFGFATSNVFEVVDQPDPMSC